MIGGFIVLIISTILLISNKMNIFISQYYSGKRIYIYIYQKIKSGIINKIFFYRFIAFMISAYVSIFSYVTSLYLLGIFNIVISLIDIKRFKVTRRSFTLFVTCIIISALLSLLMLFSKSKAIWMIFPIISLCPYLYLLICNYLLFPYESLVRLFYIKSAQKKIKMNPNLKIIGITGSFGKTSFKNYLYALLNEKYMVVKSPGSVNTCMGICKFINESLSPYDEYMILEYGVDEKKGMDRLLKIVRPHIAVITAIGEMHLTTFKSIENIKNEKLKLAYGSLDRIVFYNSDSLMTKKDFSSLTSFSYSSKDISDVTISLEGTKCLYGDIIIKTKLFGKLQLLNLIGAIEVAKYLDVSNDKISLGISKIRPVQHRLSLEKRGRIYVLDDSYNGNFQGILESIRVLKSLEGKKAIITPGMIEIGDKYYDINFAIGKELVGIDCIYLVGNDPKPLKEGYLSNGGDERKIKICDSFVMSYHLLTKERIKILLIANDTPKEYLK